MNTIAPGVLIRTADERLQEVADALCGLPWDEAARRRPKLLAMMGLERAALERSERRHRR